MALSPKLAEQALLTHQQSLVCHELIRADQLFSALQVLQKIVQSNRDGSMMDVPSRTEFNVIELYLDNEIKKCLNQIKQMKHVAAHTKPKSAKSTAVNTPVTPPTL